MNLVNAIDCTQLWTEKFDRELTVNSLFSTTDEVVYTIASITGSASVRHETLADIIRTNNPSDLDVYDCVLTWSSLYFNTWSVEDHKTARDCLEWAVKQDPNYVKAKTALAELYIYEFKNAYTHRYQDSLGRSESTPGRVPSESRPIVTTSITSKALLAFYTAECGSYDKFYVTAEKAIEFNPNNFGVVAEILPSIPAIRGNMSAA